MMDLIQWALNFMFIGCLFALMLRLKGTYQKGSYLSLSTRIEKLESRLLQLESELQTVHATVSEKMKLVDTVLEQSNRLLKNSRAGLSHFPLTVEESELKEALSFDASLSPIPSVSELEHTKIRLQKESFLDLKTLLKGQLS